MSNNLEKFIINDLNNIFRNIDISMLSDYQKREMIFDYLSKNLKYDWKLYINLTLEKIDKNRSRINRDYNLEINKVIKEHKGVCISIASYYQLLLKRLNIDSIIVATSDGTIIPHVLNIIYNKETDSYSFDDITSMITRFRNKNLCFDYDIIDAKKVNQGIKPILDKPKVNWCILPTLYIKDKNSRKQFEEVKPKILSIKKYH